MLKPKVSFSAINAISLEITVMILLVYSVISKLRYPSTILSSFRIKEI